MLRVISLKYLQTDRISFNGHTPTGNGKITDIIFKPVNILMDIIQSNFWITKFYVLGILQDSW
jgi:hypothetical protein